MTTPILPFHKRARQWREDAGLSRAELAKLAGYSQTQIVDFERGAHQDGRRLNLNAMRRYRLVCAALALGGVDFQFDAPLRVSRTTLIG